MIQVVNRAIDILEYLGQNLDRSCSLGEIALRLRLDKGTCANILKTLIDREYVTQVKRRGGYRLGPMTSLLPIGGSYERPLAKCARYAIEDLREMLNETVILSVIKNYKRHIVYKSECSHQVIVALKTDKPVYMAATGRLLLSHYSETEREDFIQHVGLPTEDQWSGLDTKEKLLARLDKIREHDPYVMKDSHHIVGFAVPVKKKGKVIASLSVFLPSFRFNDSMDSIIRRQLDITRELIEDAF